MPTPVLPVAQPASAPNILIRPTRARRKRPNRVTGLQALAGCFAFVLASSGLILLLVCAGVLLWPRKSPTELPAERSDALPTELLTEWFPERSDAHTELELEQTREWLKSGRSLVEKSALDWKNASRYDRLATCVLFVLAARREEGLLRRPYDEGSRPPLGLRLMAEELMKTLDAAIATSPELADRDALAAMPMSMLAAAAMVKLGWLADDERSEALDGF